MAAPDVPETSNAPGDVVAWGSDTEPRRSPLTTVALRLGTKERHLTVGLAGAGAVLGGLSLLVSWQVTAMPASRPAHIPATIATSVAGVDAWGAVYAVGLMGMLAAAALTLFGSGTVRRQARIAGLGWVAGLCGVLVAAAADLGNSPAALNYLYLITSADQPETTVSSGPFLALGGVALVGAALYLHGQAAGGPVEPAPAEDFAPPAVDAVRPVRKGEASRRPVAPPLSNAGPVDLTVSEATPFVHLPEPPQRW